MILKCYYIVNILATCSACLPSYQSHKEETLLPDEYDINNPTHNSTIVLESFQSEQPEPILSNVSTVVDSVIFMGSRYVRVTLRVEEVYPTMHCETEGRNLSNFSYQHRLVSADCLVLRGECTLDIKLHVQVTELQFIVSAAANGSDDTEINEMVNVKFSGSVLDTQNWPSSFVQDIKGLNVLRLQTASCMEYTERHIVECRCLSSATSFGVFSAPRFRPFQGSGSGCLYYIRDVQGADEAALIVALKTRQKCQFVCEVELSHDAPPVKATFRLVYNVTHTLSRIQMFSKYWSHLFHTWLLVIISGFVAFFLTIFFVHLQSRRQIYLCNKEIRNLMQARLKRSCSSDDQPSDAEYQQSNAEYQAAYRARVKGSGWARKQSAMLKIYLRNKEFRKLFQAGVKWSGNSDALSIETEQVETSHAGVDGNVSGQKGSSEVDSFALTDITHTHVNDRTHTHE